MKKIICYFFIILTFFSFYTRVDALEGVNITNVKVVEKSGTITLDDLDFRNDTIKSKIIFNQINDFVTYEVELDNVGSVNYKLNSIDSNIDNEYLKLSSEDIGKNIKVGKNTVRFRIDYDKELINIESIKLADTIINFKFGEGNVDNNPNTGFDYNLLLLVLIFFGLSFITIKKHRKKLLFVLLFIPMSVFAIVLLEVNLNISEITIKGRMLSYKIAVEDGNGEIKYFDKYYGDNLLVGIPIPEKDGYNFVGWVDDNNKEISSDEKVERNTRVLPKYEAVNYNIIYDLDGGVLDEDNPRTYTSDDEFTLNNPSKPGNVFAGWSSDGGETFQTKVTIYKDTTGDKYYKAYYVSAPNSNYTVIHELMNENGNYAEDSREELLGAVGTVITPQVKQYKGFTSPVPQTISFNGNNEVVTYRYSRNKYQFSIANLEDIDISKTTPNGEYYYGTDISIVAKEKAGYTIIWSDGSTEKDRTFKLTKNTNLMLIYEPIGNTQYKVIHKTMDLDGVNYSVKDEDIFTGVTHTRVMPEVNYYEGFTAPEVQSLRIMPNGKAELVYLYTRNKYNLDLEDSEYIESSFTSGSYYYGTEINLEAKKREGYEFVGWSNGETSSSIAFTLEKDVIIRPRYKSHNTSFDTGPIVNRKMKALAGTSPSYYSPEDNNIENIIRSTILPDDFEETEDNTISTEDSKYPIYIWYDDNNKTINYYTEANEIYLNDKATYMFYNMRKLGNIDGINSWNTSYTTDMSRMFGYFGYNISNFSLNLSNWDTSNVTSMEGMFADAGEKSTSWVLDGLSNWNTSNVLDISNMFYHAGYNVTDFYLDLTNWDTSKVTDMTFTFNSIGHKASNWYIAGISDWNTSSVTDMYFTFCNLAINSTVSNLDLSNWDVSNVTDMRGMFYESFYKVTDWNVGNLSNWDTSNVTNMHAMFEGSGLNTSNLVLDLSGWDVSNVVDMSNMFERVGYNSISLSIVGISDFDTSSVTNMSSMFEKTGYNLTNFELNISDWDVSNVSNMCRMFESSGYNAETFNLDLSNWNPSSTTNMSYMFEAAGLKSTTWDIGNLSNWNVSNVTDMSWMFSATGTKSEIWNIGDLSNWDVSNVTDMGGIFSSAGVKALIWNIGNLTNWDTSNIKSMYSMFNSAGHNATTWYIGDISSWDTSKVTSMSYMFNYAGHNATTWDIGNLSNWNTSKVIEMTRMFLNSGYKAKIWNIGDLSNWNTSNVTNMQDMFDSAGYSAATWDIGNLSNWNTSKVKNMSGMFASAGYSATTWDIGNLSNWDTSKVTNMNSMFSSSGYNATSWSIGDLSNWDTSQVKLMSAVFSKAGYNATSWSIGDLSNWDTSKAIYMDSMFSGAGYSAINWNSIGTLDIYADSIPSIFMDCPNAKAILNIYSNPPSNYDPSRYGDAFKNAATIAGAQIIVNYSSVTSNINRIIATKSSNSNVIKGELLD